MSDKTCFRCDRPIPPGPISFLPGDGWACPPRDRAACDEAFEASVARLRDVLRDAFVGVVLDEGEIDLGVAYGERVTRPHPLTPDDENLLRNLLDSTAPLPSVLHVALHTEEPPAGHEVDGSGYAKRDTIPPCESDATLCGGTPDDCWRHDATDGKCPR